MYRCSVCQCSSQPGEKRKVHVVYRDNGSILREHPLCHDCYEAVYEEEIPYTVLRRMTNRLETVREMSEDVDIPISPNGIVGRRSNKGPLR